MAVSARDRVAALATISARVEALGERLVYVKLPLALLAELRSIQRAVDAVREDLEREANAS